MSSDDKTNTKRNFKPTDKEYVVLFESFASVLNVKGRLFNQSNRPRFGISDGKQGIQWNLAVFKDSGAIQLGVNLEGSEKTGLWLIAPFILSKPNIERIKTDVNNPENIFIRFVRDAWQGPGKTVIKEQNLDGEEREFALSEMDSQHWELILKEALTCLDSDKNFRGRKKQQTVTLKSNGKEITRDISPHLTIWSPMNLDEKPEEAIRRKIAELQPVYDWVKKTCQH